MRQILREAGISWQATKTWKASRDPDFAAKMARVLDLYDHPPADGRVICVDEFGPLNLQPRPGRGWFPTRPPGPAARHLQPHRRGAAHVRRADLATGQMFYRFRDRKRWQEFLGFLKQLRARFPTGKLYVVCDNFSPHKKAEVVDWCADHDVELVFTPSNASWLNWIECEFTALRYFTLDGSDYPSHTAQEAAIAGYVRWRNKHANPNDTSPSTPRSADPITYPTLLDEALAPDLYAQPGAPLYAPVLSGVLSVYDRDERPLARPSQVSSW